MTAMDNRKKTDSISAHGNETAAQYDLQVQEYDSYAHDILFGMCFEYCGGAGTVLDVGIGTGLASEPFARLGYSITGIDASNDMLEACASKGFTETLIQHDLADLPLPAGDDGFDFVISSGVFHFFQDLSALVTECARAVKTGGMFAFSAAGFSAEEEAAGLSSDWLEQQTVWNVTIYKHSIAYIERILDDAGFILLKKQRLLIKSGDGESCLPFIIYVAREKY